MTITVPQFRADYPEFSSTSVYPNAQLQYWLTLAPLLMNADRWGALMDMGTELFMAHHITLEAKAMAEAKNGGIPGITTGPVSSKSADKVSISYDVGSSIVPDAGHWNLTIYGTRFIQLLRMFGAGPIQLGIGVVPIYSGAACTGPWTGSTPSPSN